MLVRPLCAFALLALLGASPASARPGQAQVSVTPASVLANTARHGFADRTARLGSIMGPETAAVPMRLPTAPGWKRPVRHDADAAASR